VSEFEPTADFESREEFELNQSHLDREIARKFGHYTIEQLARRIERAKPFDYDDEAYELNRRLKALGNTAWKFVNRDGFDAVVIYEIEPEPDDNVELGYN